VVGQQVSTPTPGASPLAGRATLGANAITPSALPANPTAVASSNLSSGRFNILVMGVDQRPQNEASRSDTLILVSVNPISKTVAFMSIPRDMAVQIPGYGEDKINSAYFYGEYYKEPGGGPGLAVATVEQLFKVPIKYYLTVNFDGFQKIVDAVGGIDIDVPYAITDDEYPTPDEKTITIHFDAGLQHMDGARALIYARTRHADGDFARQTRQRQVILAVRSKALQLNMLPNLPNLINSVGDTVQTNLTLGDQIGLAQMLSGISSSNVISCAISADMIVPYSTARLGDSFTLDWKAAAGELNKLFGGDYGYTAPPAASKPTATASGG
jgi:LCP family protein required for cell wall assembly